LSQDNFAGKVNNFEIKQDHACSPVAAEDFGICQPLAFFFVEKRGKLCPFGFLWEEDLETSLGGEQFSRQWPAGGSLMGEVKRPVLYFGCL